MIFDFTHFLRRRNVLPVEHSAALDGVVLGQTANGERVLLPRPRREAAGHALVAGLSGGGKSVLIVNSAIELHRLEVKSPPAEGRTTTILIDPKADLAKYAVAGMAAHGHLSDLILLSPFEGRGFAYNWNYLPRTNVPVELVASQLGQLVGELSTSNSSLKHLGIGPKQLETIQVLLTASMTTGTVRGSPLLAIDALQHPQGIAALSSLTENDDAREGLKNLNNLSDDSRAALLSRLRAALASTPELAAMHSAPGCIDFENDICRPGAFVVLNIGEPPAGALFLSRFVANSFLRLLVNSLLRRPSPFDGHHVRIIIDESPMVLNVLADVAEILLTTGRSRAVSVTLCTQSVSAIHEHSAQLLKTITTNCPLRLVTRLNASDSELLVREISSQADEPVSAVRSRLAATICALPRQTFLGFMPDGRRLTFRSADIDLPAWEHAADENRGLIAEQAALHALRADVPPRVRLLDAVRAAHTGRKLQAVPAQGPRPRSKFG